MEKTTQKSGFWDNSQEAVKVNQEISKLKEESEEFENLEVELELMESEEDIRNFENKIKQKELQIFLSGEHDRGNAILSIYSGAGGQDAQDWASMLLRMYLRYCDTRSFKTKILHQSFGGVGAEGRIGIKSVTLEIKGSYAFGFLKKESGVHRLVRISPFSAQSLRHTSFALVEVLPELGKDIEKEIQIKPDDLQIDLFRSSGPGGQNVNKRETAVRITHLPTKIVVSCQAERTQPANKEKAMELLYAKLYQLRETEKEKEKAKLKGKAVFIEWGNQIRSYVLHPYKMVKDLRTNVETSDTEAVLDGKLDEFIEAELKLEM